jgi:hypothetical protein
MQKSMVFEPNFCLTFLKLEIDGNVEEIEINLHNISIKGQQSHFYKAEMRIFII